MTEPYVHYEIKDEIATIEFFHPKSNSFPTSQLNKLISTFETLGNHDQVKVIILQSYGDKVFCAGASFDELLEINDFETGQKFFMGFANLILSMRNCPKFIVGKISGRAVGGGVGLVSACDYALATDVSSVRLSELSIGIGPFVIEPAITRKIGINAFSEMTLNPKIWEEADWCDKVGLYNKVFSTTDDLHYACNEFAQQLSAYSLQAMRDLKSILWEDAKNWDEIMPQRAAMSGELVLSDYTKNTLKKFKSKT